VPMPMSSPCPKKVRQVRSNIKSMLVIFLDCEGIVRSVAFPVTEYNEVSLRLSAGSTSLCEGTVHQ
jgi:glutamine synthetase